MDAELKGRLDALERLVLNLTSMYRNDLMWRELGGSPSPSMLRQWREELGNIGALFRFHSDFRPIFVPLDFHEVYFYILVEKHGRSEKVPRLHRARHGTLPERVVKKLFNNGYEKLSDLNGVPFCVIYSLPGFGPAACRDFVNFLVEEGLYKKIVREDLESTAPEPEETA